MKRHGLKVKVEGGKITFSPKSVVDRHLAKGLADLKMGRSHGPYSSAKEAITASESRAVKTKPKRR